MDAQISRKQLKTEVKETLRGHWGKAILLNLIPIIISIFMTVAAGIVSFAIQMAVKSTSFESAFDASSRYSGGGHSAGSFAFNIVASFIYVAISYTFVDWLRSNDAPESAFKKAFQTFSRKYFTSTLAISLLTYIFTFLWTLLLIIPGIIKSIAYSQAYLIYKDSVDSGNPDVRYLECITKSRALMNGHKGEYFVLQLSYLGWAILSGITLGIGFIWLVPYMRATNTNFYRHLVK
ncbi:DUF975 family protein [Secundilactobacillus malefermentans]|nr:DUF975 family protein [Secundilactobacillus malefermentans]